MRQAPIGAEVGIYYDSPNRVKVDDFLQTPSGRSYRIVSVRIQDRGKHIGRQHLRAVVSDPREIASHDTVYRLHWYSRSAPSGTPRNGRGRLITTTVLPVLGWLSALLVGLYYACNYVGYPHDRIPAPGHRPDHGVVRLAALEGLAAASDRIGASRPRRGEPVLAGGQIRHRSAGL